MSENTQDTLRARIGALREQIARVYLGDTPAIDWLICCLLSRGHVLLEDVPGVGKTLLASTLAKSIDCPFSRIQLTPDMLPADLLGVSIYSRDGVELKFQQGPIFTSVLLADEINRTTPRTQSALLEAMQERQGTIGSETFKLDEPFLVLATQNPIEQEGTYPLPEAQVDRFMLKVVVDYPTKEEERKVVDRMASGQPIPEMRKVASPEDIMSARATVERIWIDEKVRDYLVDVARATRNPSEYGISELEDMIETGASPRASISLMRGAKAHAFLQSRSYVTPHDVKSVATEILRHRVILTYEAEAEGKTNDDIIRKILDNVPVP